MSLAGRFFPSTMRMDSEVRLAIVGPRDSGSRPGESDARVPGSAQPAAGKGRTGRPGGGPRRAAGGGGAAHAGAEASLPLHSPPPPPHVRGTLLPGGPIGGWGWFGLRRLLAARGG